MKEINYVKKQMFRGCFYFASPANTQHSFNGGVWLNISQVTKLRKDDVDTKF